METDKSMTRPVLRRPDDDNDGLVALPPVPLVRQRLRASVKEFAASQPGRRAAALAAAARGYRVVDFFLSKEQKRGQYLLAKKGDSHP